MNLLQKGMQILNEEVTQYEQLCINVENEYQAMCCGAFNPRLLARIKRSKADNRAKKNKETTPLSDEVVSAKQNRH